MDVEDDRMGRERGGALPLLALAVAGLLLVTVLLGLVAERALHRARAQAAADAAALAGAAEGRDAAVRLAVANGALLTEYRSGDGRIEAVVEIAGVRATAVAEVQMLAPDDQ